MTIGQWLGKWAGQWLGSGEPAPEGSISGAATISLSATAQPTAVVEISGTASLSMSAAGSIAESPIDPPVTTWASAWGMSWGNSWGDGADVPVSLASLGGWPAKKRKKAHEDNDLEEVSEAFPADVVSRIRNEMLSASLAQDVIARAKSRAKRMRSEEEALLLML